MVPKFTRILCFTATATKLKKAPKIFWIHNFSETDESSAKLKLVPKHNLTKMAPNVPNEPNQLNFWIPNQIQNLIHPTWIPIYKRLTTLKIKLERTLLLKLDCI